MFLKYFFFKYMQFWVCIFVHATCHQANSLRINPFAGDAARKCIWAISIARSPVLRQSPDKSRLPEYHMRDNFSPYHFSSQLSAQVTSTSIKFGKINSRPQFINMVFSMLFIMVWTLKCHKMFHKYSAHLFRNSQRQHHCMCIYTFRSAACLSLNYTALE